MPRRWSTNTRLWAYRYLVLRDGEMCSRCYERPATRNSGSAAQNVLEIDHIDGNPFNNDPDNLRLLCKSCNVALGNKARFPTTRNYSPSDLCECVRERERKEGKASTRITREALDFRSPDSPVTMQASFLYELDFRKWLLGRVLEKGFITKQDAINAGAEVVGCSPVTSARYLAKLTSSAGVIQETRDMLGETVLTWKDGLKPEETILVDLDHLSADRAQFARQGQP